MKITPEQDNYHLDTEKMVEVSDQLVIHSYVIKDPQFGEDTLILKISGENISPIGFNLGVAMSPKVLKHLKYTLPEELETEDK